MALFIALRRYKDKQLSIQVSALGLLGKRGCSRISNGGAMNSLGARAPNVQDHWSLVHLHRAEWHTECNTLLSSTLLHHSQLLTCECFHGLWQRNLHNRQTALRQPHSYIECFAPLNFWNPPTNYFVYIRSFVSNIFCRIFPNKQNKT